MFYSRQIPDFRTFVRAAAVLTAATGIAVAATVGIAGTGLRQLQLRDHALAVAETEALLAEHQVIAFAELKQAPFPR
jgi:hypothetical protein